MLTQYLTFRRTWVSCRNADVDSVSLRGAWESAFPSSSQGMPPLVVSKHTEKTGLHTTFLLFTPPATLSTYYHVSSSFSLAVLWPIEHSPRVAISCLNSGFHTWLELVSILVRVPRPSAEHNGLWTLVWTNSIKANPLYSSANKPNNLQRGVLSAGPLTLWASFFFITEDCSVHCRMFISIPGYYLLEDSNIHSCQH